jgi:hypothetical protein
MSGEIAFLRISRLDTEQITYDIGANGTIDVATINHSFVSATVR